VPAKLRARLTYANVVATLALFVALGGSSYAALTVTGKNVKNSSLSGKDIKDNSVTGRDVKSIKSGDVTDRSLLAKDFKAGQLPAGARGEKGDKGDPATALFARVAGKGDAGGAVLGPSSGVTGAAYNSSGNYTVTFDRDVSRCAPLADAGSANSGVSEFISSDVLATTRTNDVNSNQVRVLLERIAPTAGQPDNVSFNLAVLC
jgi:hypothetical protein